MTVAVPGKLEQIFDKHREWLVSFLDYRPALLTPGIFKAEIRFIQATTLINEHLTAALSEIEEIRDLLPWKSWKTYESRRFDLDRIREEIIDLFHFVVGMSILTGMDAETFWTVYRLKQDVNRARQIRRKKK